MLQISNLHLSYGEQDVIKGIDLAVNKGDVVTFIGPSGTGKTTLLKCINYLTVPHEGSITIGEMHLDYNAIRKQDVLRLRRKTAMVFQQFNIFKHKTVIQNVMDAQIAVQKKSKTAAYEHSAAQLSKVGMLDKKDAYPATLSGGQLQRVGIARALAVNPEILLFDEPTSSLDPELVDEVLNVIEDIAHSGITILLVTHEMEFARKISSQVVFMEKGTIIEQGPPEQIFETSANERTKRFLKSYYTDEKSALKYAK